MYLVIYLVSSIASGHVNVWNVNLMSRYNGSSKTYEASSIQSSFSKMASMWGLVMTTSFSSSSDCSLWVSMAPIRSNVGL